MWVNNNNYIFTLADEAQQRPKNNYRDYEHGWLSLAVYQADQDKIKICKRLRHRQITLVEKAIIHQMLPGALPVA